MITANKNKNASLTQTHTLLFQQLMLLDLNNQEEEGRDTVGLLCYLKSPSWHFFLLPRRKKKSSKKHHRLKKTKFLFDPKEATNKISVLH